MVTTKVYHGDAAEVLKKYPDGHFNLIVTSPPYADARKKHYDSIRPEEYPDFIAGFHEEFMRVLAEDGSFVLNMKDKVVNGVRHRYVWRTIDKLTSLGWRCIDDYIWIKPNAMPGYWRTRFRDEWEYCFHLSKNGRFAMYQDTVKKPIGGWVEKRLAKLNGKSNMRHNSENDSGFGRDLRNWKNKTHVLPGNTIMVPLVGKNMGHPAVFPVGLPEFFIKLFTKPYDNVLDPFAGSGTTGIAAEMLKRNSVLIDTKLEYIQNTRQRLEKSNAKARRIFYINGKIIDSYEKGTPLELEFQNLGDAFQW